MFKNWLIQLRHLAIGAANAMAHSVWAALATIATASSAQTVGGFFHWQVPGLTLTALAQVIAGAALHGFFNFVRANPFPDIPDATDEPSQSVKATGTL